MDFLVYYLIHCRRDGSDGEKILKLLDREVADSNGSGEAKFLAFYHGLPHTLHIKWQQILDINWE